MAPVEKRFEKKMLMFYNCKEVGMDLIHVLVDRFNNIFT